MPSNYSKSVRISSKADDLLSERARSLGVSKSLLLNWLIESNIEKVNVKFEIPDKSEKEEEPCENS